MSKGMGGSRVANFGEMNLEPGRGARKKRRAT